MDDPRRVAVEQPGADVERLTVRQQSNFGALGDRLAFAQLALDEVGLNLAGFPGVIIEFPVDHRRLRNHRRRSGAGGRRRGGGNDLCGSGPAGECGQAGREEQAVFLHDRDVQRDWGAPTAGQVIALRRLLPTRRPAG